MKKQNISKKRILHLMSVPSGHYETSYIRFISRNVDLNINFHHDFYFPMVTEEKNILNRYSSYFDKCLQTLSQTHCLVKLCSNADMIIIHGWFNIYLSTFLLCVPGVIRKTQWVIWGGDLYNWNLIQKRTIGDYINEFLKKRVIKQFASIIYTISGDYSNAKLLYNITAPGYHAFLLPPLNKELLDKTNTFNDNNHHKNILLGTRGSRTSYHFEAIDFLSFINTYTNFRVICPLSYGGDKNYISRVVTYGKEKLGEKFEPLLSWLGPNEYAEVLASIDVAIMNHRRQEGVGNIIPLLYAGKKVYIRKNVSTYSWLTKLGLIIFNTDDLFAGKDNDIFTFPHEWGKHNREIIQSYYSEENCVQLWKKVFES
jgi:dTDP-N-acetylfucosamine:lipid II N-acetylfucosaminyltransferase